MTRIIFIALFVLLFASGAYADQFRLIDDKNAYIAYASVYVESLPKGYTDKYGRITIHLPIGVHSGEVEYRGQRKSIRLIIDGKRGLKVVRVE